MLLVITPRADIEHEAGRAVARKFIQNIKNRVKILRRQPFVCMAQPQFGQDIRRMVVKPYLVFYHVQKETVFIVRVLHGARKVTCAMIK